MTDQRYGDWMKDDEKIAAYRRMIGNLRRGQHQQLTQKQQWDLKAAVAEAQSLTGVTVADLESLITALRNMLEELLGRKAARAEGFIKDQET